MRNLFQKIDDFRGDRRILNICFIVAILLVSVFLRYKLIPGVSDDYTYFISNWYDHLKLHGFSGFKDQFANYNFPYLFLLYLVSLIPIDKLIAIKLISIFFDFILAVSIYLLVNTLTKNKTKSLFASLLILLLPTVFVNSAFWGQTDAIYVSFIILSLGMFLKKRYSWGWILFGVSLAFKMQAIFFIPVLFYIWFKRKGKWFDPFYALASFLIMSLPPILVGKSLVNTLSVYLNQYGYQTQLSANIPNFYFWIPNTYFPLINSVGILFAIGITILFTYYALIKLPYSLNGLVYLTAFSSLLIPYLLPQMHDRYFYLFEILASVLVVIIPKFVLASLVMQFVTLNVYMRTLLSNGPIPFGFLSGLVTIIVILFIYDFRQRTSITNYARRATL